MNIFLGIVCYDNIKPSFMMDVINLLNHEFVKNVIMNQGCLLPMNRCELVAKTLKQFPDWTHMLLLDSDMADITPELIDLLLMMETDIASPLYTMRKPPFHPALKYPGPFAEFIDIFKLPIEQRPIIDVDHVGLGCALVRREVFETIPFPYFFMDRLTRPNFDDEARSHLDSLMDSLDGEVNIPMKLREFYNAGLSFGKAHNEGTGMGGEDVNFCRQARRYGFSVKVHTGAYISHIGETKYNIGDTIEFWKNPALLSRLEQMTYAWRPKDD